MKITKTELLENEVKAVNEQLYKAYNRITELNEKIAILEKENERNEKYIEHLLGECPVDCKLCGE
jgi:hypothetical protein